jgi:hypothetical protein
MHKSIIALVGAAGIGVATLAAPAPASADCIGCAIGAGLRLSAADDSNLSLTLGVSILTRGSEFHPAGLLEPAGSFLVADVAGCARPSCDEARNRSETSSGERSNRALSVILA